MKFVRRRRIFGISFGMPKVARSLLPSAANILVKFEIFEGNISDLGSARQKIKIRGDIIVIKTWAYRRLQISRTVFGVDLNFKATPTLFPANAFSTFDLFGFDEPFTFCE